MAGKSCEKQRCDRVGHKNSFPAKLLNFTKRYRYGAGAVGGEMAGKYR